MQQEERSERSRAAILDAALSLFSHQGYRATSVRDIAEKAAVSTGSVYHHFRDKEAIFNALLDHFWNATVQPDFPLNLVFEAGAFPNDLAAIGNAAREVVLNWRPYIALIYVDVVEFDGQHIHRFYADLATRYEDFLVRRADLGIPAKLRDGLKPPAAMLFTTRVFIYYSVVEILFGVPNHLGMSSDEARRMIADVLKNGLLK